MTRNYIFPCERLSFDQMVGNVEFDEGTKHIQLRIGVYMYTHTHTHTHRETPQIFIFFDNVAPLDAVSSIEAPTECRCISVVHI